MTLASPAPTKRRFLSKRVLFAAVGVVVIVATFAYFLPTIADYRDVWVVVKGLSWGWIVALLVAAALNIATFAPPWMILLPGLRFWPALMTTQAATALSIVFPGGAAVGIAGSYGMLRRRGFPPADVARAVTLVSLWNQLANLAYPILALFLLTAEGAQTAVLATAAFVGVGVLGVAIAGLVLVLYSGRMAEDIGDAFARLTNWARRRLLGRGPVTWGGREFGRFRRDAVGVLVKRWHLLTLATFAGSLTVFAVLVVSLRALGVSGDEVTIAEAFAAWSLARILGTIPITPAGIGVVELSLTATLIGFGGNNAEVVASVLVYRFLTMIPTLLLGLLAAATFRRSLRKLAAEPPV
jgi:putative heme transporter